MIADSPRRTLLERQLQILQAMILAYGTGLSAMAQMNLEQINEQNQTLEALSGELRSVNRLLAGTVAGSRDRDALRAIAAAVLEVRRLNQIYRAVARRCARNVRARLNVIAPVVYQPNANAGATCAEYTPMRRAGGFQAYV